MREKVLQQIAEKKIIAIVRGIEPEKILKLAQALLDGGINMIEVTFNQRNPERFSDTTTAIAAIVQHFGDQILVGAGTVMTPEQVQMAADAGAKYIISPDTNVEVIKKTRELNLVSLPGAFTPTEMVLAHNCGADYVKAFPAGNFGPEYIKAVKAPLSHIKLLGVGGINAQNIPAFLKAGCEGFGIGGNLVNKTWIDNEEFEKITECAREYCRAVGR